MEIFDSKKKCEIEGCDNVGAWNKIKGNKVYRRKFCDTHFNAICRGVGYSGRKTWEKEKYKEIKCGKCEYCDWVGPCDIHRPNEGRYTNGNMRSTCPNCHRLISRSLIIDKFKVE